LSCLVLNRDPTSPLLDGREDVDPRVDIYNKIDADVYCVFGVNQFVAEVAAFCKRYGKKFVLFLGSDIDHDITYHNHSKYITDIFNQANLIITQTDRQSQMIHGTFGKHTVTIRNPIDLTSSEVVSENVSSRKSALWIGKSDRIKQPEILLKLAQRF